MTLKLTDYGALDMLGWYFDDDFTVELFTDDHAVTDGAGGDDSANRTPAAYATGVTGTLLTRELLSEAARIIAVDASGVPTITWTAPLTWVFTGPLENGGKVNGYMVQDSSNNTIFQEALDEPFEPRTDGDQLVLTVQFKLGNPLTGTVPV